MKNNRKEKLTEANDIPTTKLVSTKSKIKRITRKLNSYKEFHVALASIITVGLMCFSLTTAVTMQVQAQEAEQILTPQSIILVPTKVIEEADTDGDTYKDSKDVCPDVAPVYDDGTGCEVDSDKDGYLDIYDTCPSVKPTTDDGTGCEVVVVEEPISEEPVAEEAVAETESNYPLVDYTANMIHRQNTDMSYMAVNLSSNADYYSNGYYCGEDRIAHEEGTDAVLVAMGSQYEYGQYYEVEISNYGTVLIKKVEEKGTTENNEGYIGPSGDSIELMVCDGFDPNGVGKSSNLGMYVEAIYKASY